MISAIGGGGVRFPSGCDPWQVNCAPHLGGVGHQIAQVGYRRKRTLL